MSNAEAAPMNAGPSYYRRDREEGISPPDLSKACTFAEHIVRARGKRTRFTSVSLDPASIRDFGDTLYRLQRSRLETDGHQLVEHGVLLGELQRTIRESDKDERLRAVQALRYARRRREGLIDWQFDIAGIERKALLGWAARNVMDYFVKA